MMLVVGIIIGLLVLILLVAAHELGHAIVARRNGVVVEEFAIGFPPKALSKKPKKSFLGKNVIYSFNWLPLGGYVRMQGEYDCSNKKGDYGAAGYWAKTKILFAGVAVNWAIAAILLTILAWTGLPKITDNQFTIMGDTRTEVVEPGKVVLAKIKSQSVAEKAGLQQGDVVLRINQEPVTAASQLSRIIKLQREAGLTLTVDRSGVQKNVTVSPTNEILGVGIGEYRARELRYSTWSAPLVGIGTTIQFTGLTLQGLGDMVVKLATGLVDKFNTDESVRTTGNKKLDEVSQSVTGPLGILAVIFPQAGQGGVTAVVFLAALISLSLAVMNTLPIPALDGGRWAVMTWYRVRNKVLTQEREEKIQTIGIVTLLVLMILVTIADIGKVR
ncbi:MAG: M50 family metallopeptidase [Candidatus Saccharibacteria bacterium]|nr:M50 family metallopeptidase [Candidatus Saccharibacteria bacterium]